MEQSMSSGKTLIKWDQKGIAQRTLSKQLSIGTRENKRTIDDEIENFVLFSRHSHRFLNSNLEDICKTTRRSHTVNL